MTPVGLIEVPIACRSISAFGLLEVLVEERKYLSDDVWIGDVHMGHVGLNNETVFQPNLLALSGQSFHLSGRVNHETTEASRRRPKTWCTEVSRHLSLSSLAHPGVIIPEATGRPRTR